MKKTFRTCLVPLILCLILLSLCACRAKTGINASIDAAEFIVVRVYTDETVSESTITDEEDVAALKEACRVLGESEDGGYDHQTIELIFAGEESEIILYPSLEVSDYILTKGGTFYRTGLDRRVDLIETLAKYGIFLS